MNRKDIITRKHSVILSAALFAAAGLPLFAADLSPRTEAILLRDSLQQVHSPLRAPGTEATEPTINTYITVDAAQTANAIERLEALGATVRRTYSADDATVTLTAAVPVNILRQAAEVEGVTYISAGRDVNLLNDYSRKEAGVNTVHDGTDELLQRPFTGKGVILGLIDTGVEYAHPAFFTPDGTELRIRAVWDQNSDRGTAPEEYGYGSEFTTPETIMSRYYDTAEEFHGSHTMGIAAGADMSSKFYGVATEADIVYVSMGPDDTNITDGISYIFDYADRAGKPCVINMSLGSHIGPHDGTSVTDRIIDSMTGPGHIIVGACGNEGEYKIHCSKTLGDGDTQLKTILTFNDAIYHKIHKLDIWSTEGDPFTVKMCVVNSLKGQILATSDTFDPSQQKILYNYFDMDKSGADTEFVFSGETNPANGRPHVDVTCEVNGLGEGRRLGIIIEGQPGSTIHMWNYSNHEFSSMGRSGWTDGDNAYTVGEIGGTAKSIITVGSYDGRTTVPFITGQTMSMTSVTGYDHLNVSMFSSRGPTADGRTVPHILASGFPVISAANKYALEVFGLQLSTDTNGKTTTDRGSFYYMYNIGTSMAAPFVAGTVALMLEADPTLDPEEVKDIITSTADASFIMSDLPNNTYGSGRINTLEAMKELIRRASADNIIATQNDCRLWYEPSASQIVVAIPGYDGPARLTLTDIRGMTAFDTSVNGPLTTVDLTGSHLDRGIYIATVSYGDTRHTTKLAL